MVHPHQTYSVRRRSSFEGFFASKGSAFALPDGDFARKASKHGGEMQMHLQSMVNLLRDDDVLRLVVKLEGASKDRVRYLTVVSAFNEDDIEESIAMGVDWVNTRATCTIGMVLPLWRDAKIELDGDGGFKLTTNYKSHILKPVSVQTMWTAVQWIHRCSENARKNNQFPNGLSHQWSNFYSSHISSDQACINEWHEMEDISSKLIQLPTGITQEEELMMKLIKHRLKEVSQKIIIYDNYGNAQLQYSLNCAELHTPGASSGMRSC
ncbi:protein phosphatase Slingshot homolog 1 isoform X3 [Exaiptasia diaphana]|uniref:Slingshot N-terminal domain-containing protein n=1 Tax=Exaiptasia diaphana TaxID=2652724 RepID=A0A913YRJ6_EXADI|nr:protein phosphatase Slingshot homolog 1 isoform X3 [Exaiptasia diaphana]